MRFHLLGRFQETKLNPVGHSCWLSGSGLRDNRKVQVSNDVTYFGFESHRVQHLNNDES